MIKYILGLIMLLFLHANTCYLLVSDYKKLVYEKQEYYVMGLADQLKSQFESMSKPNGNVQTMLSCIVQGNSTAWANKLNDFIKSNPNYQKRGIDGYCVVDIYGHVVVNECLGRKLN